MPAYRTRDTPVRSLEVTVVDALEAAPAFNVVSPTPRAFTFPPHAHVPSPSPSNSPFEPDLRTLTLTPSSSSAAAFSASTSTPPPPAFISADSVQSSPVAPAPAPAPERSSHRRRRSTASDINERRPKRGDEDYIKRPENAFILFRRKCCEDRNSALDDTVAAGAPLPKKQRQADLSKAISAQWRSLPPEEKQYWEDLAKEKKKEHAEQHPNYVYRPVRIKKGKAAASAKGKGKSEDEPETDGEISFTLPVSAVPSRPGRRAVSAPTPPPAFQQTIQIPALYMPTPTSPLEVAMISNNRRTSAPSTLESELGWTFPSADDHADFSQPQGWQPDPQADDVFTNVYDLSQMSFVEAPKRDVPLDPLTVPNDPAMFMSHASALISPESYRTASSGTSSPHLGPFTPGTLETVQMPADLWQQHADMQMVPAPVSMSQERVQPHQLAYHNAYAGWGDMWPTNSQPLFNEDFDLSLIPPISMEVPKFDTAPPMGMGGCEERDPMFQTFSFDGMVAQAMTADGY